MKKNILSLIMVIALVTGCTPKQASIPAIDVTSSYPEKEIILTDIADVSYLHLNADNDEFLYQGGIAEVSPNHLVVYNQLNGDILFFTKEGQPTFHFNRKGTGPEEYIMARRIIFDEKADDIFILSALNNIMKVYSSTGQYKRKLILPEATMINGCIDFDDESIFIFDASFGAKKSRPESYDSSIECLDYPLARVSKADGKVLGYAPIPDNGIILKDMVNGVMGRTTRLLPSPEGVLLCNPETDTVFLYNKQKELIPVLCKTPSIKGQDPLVYLNNCMDAGRYQLAEVYTARWEEGCFPFPVKYYARDKQTGEIFRYKTTLPDYKGYEFNIRKFSGMPRHDYYYELDLGELAQAYDENRLSGPLKELVATLNADEDNNIYMRVRFK